MRLNLLGINHHSAPVAVREKVAIQAVRLPEVLSLLKKIAHHGVVISTCNRTEIYTLEDDSNGGSMALDFLAGYAGVLPDDVHEHLYCYKDRQAAEHLFKVASGLDSMIVGEYEILGQIGQLFEAAEEARLVNLPLRRVFQDAIRIGRTVRDETNISKNALSVSSVAIELAGRIVKDIAACRLLVIGAGEAGRLVAQTARDRGTTSITVASRKLLRAETLADELGGKAVEFENIFSELGDYDLIITCADAPHCIINFGHLDVAMRNRNGNPLVMIDIAVPRNVEAAVKDLKGVYLYNIDDLNDVSEQNHNLRKKEINRVEKIIAAEADKFDEWWCNLSIRPVIGALVSKANRIRHAHLEKTIKKLPPLSEEEKYSLDKMTESIVIKLLKGPINTLKENTNDNGDYARIINDIFRLDEEEAE
ncbi:glutamyl-tRNA reductase [Chloroflexota bacterium]